MRGAFAAFGKKYNPALAVNRFEKAAEDFDAPGEPSNPEKASPAEYVSVTPNPANPITTITYSIKSPPNVRLSIYSINGQKVAAIVDGRMSAGAHAVTFDGSKYASGVYFYWFESAWLKKSGKMLLLK